jgi:hypothetical protein
MTKRAIGSSAAPEPAKTRTAHRAAVEREPPAGELERKRAAIRQGQASLRKKRGVPLDAVERWVESWDTATELPKPRGRRIP